MFKKILAVITFCICLTAGQIYYANLKKMLNFKNSYQITYLDAGHIDTMDIANWVINNLTSGMLGLNIHVRDGIIVARREM